jgi:hypothetical protein
MHSSILRRIWLNSMAHYLVFSALLQFSQFFRISNFFGLSTTDETWLVEMRIWCIKIGIVLVLYIRKQIIRTCSNSRLYLQIAFTSGSCLWYVYLSVESICKKLFCTWSVFNSGQSTDKHIDGTDSSIVSFTDSIPQFLWRYNYLLS